jgi:hypothetical protein
MIGLQVFKNVVKMCVYSNLRNWILLCSIKT